MTQGSSQRYSVRWYQNMIKDLPEAVILNSILVSPFSAFTCWDDIIEVYLAPPYTLFLP